MHIQAWTMYLQYVVIMCVSYMKMYPRVTYIGVTCYRLSISVHRVKIYFFQHIGMVYGIHFRYKLLHTNCGVKSILLVGFRSLHIINYVNIAMCFYESQ